MPATILVLHSIWRWVVIVVAAVAVVKAVVGWLGRQPFARLDDRLGMSYTVAMDIQVLLGLILYVIEQRWSGSDPFFSYIHPLVMIIALVLAHIGRGRSRKAESDEARHRAAAIFFAISLFLVVAAVPWNRVFRG